MAALTDSYHIIIALQAQNPKKRKADETPGANAGAADRCARATTRLSPPPLPPPQTACANLARF